MRILITTILCTAFLLNSKAQENKITFSGFVYDSITREIVIGVLVRDIKNKVGTQSNEFGFYSLTLPTANDTAAIYFSLVGYETKKIVFKKGVNSRMNVFMTSNNYLKEVEITDSRSSNKVMNAETGVSHIPIRDIKKLPNLFGEVDAIQSLRLTPGVQSGGEGKSNLFVRGGSADQNLILLDDVPLYYVGHFGGFISVFNADAINDVKLIKGGFPARYGSRLSSVLDVRMKEGNRQKKEVNGSAGLLSSKLSLSMPLFKEKSSFIISARMNLFPIFFIMGAGIRYTYYDVNAKANYFLSERDRLFVSFYKGDDVVWAANRTKENLFNSKSSFSTQWGNTMGALRWNHVYNSKLFSNLTLSTTLYNYQTQLKYSFSNDTLEKSVNSLLSTGIQDRSAKIDYSYFLTPRTNFKFGAVATHHSFTPNDQRYKQTATNHPSIDSVYNSKINALENAVYIESIWQYTRLSANAGIRSTFYHIEDKNYFSVEPRLVVGYFFNQNLSVKYSYSAMNQYVHLLSYSGVGMPSDYWMPATRNTAPESSLQHSLGLYKTMKQGLYECSLELYYKSMNNLIAFKPGKSLTGNLTGWENLIERDGIGTNYGAEFFIQKMKGRTTGWISTTLSKSLRKFNFMNEGNTFPFKYDRPIDFSIVLIQHINEKINLSATWNYGTGYPVTLSAEQYKIGLNNIFIYDKINSFRMRDYHRLDIAANFTKKKKWGERTWTVSIFNLYNRQNSYYYFYQQELEFKQIAGGFTTVPVGVKLYQRSLFPFLPSIAYSFKF